MKLKELPLSLLRAWQLKKIPLSELQHSSPTDLPIVVSLTSIASRLDLVPLTLRSLLSQTHKPEKVVLWLNEKLKNKLPENLQALQGNKFEIRYDLLDCPHMKLVCSLSEFPHKIIVTSDDDLMYETDWLNRLYQDHLLHPQAIIANECRHIIYDAQGNALPYSDWNFESSRSVSPDSILALGYGGVLYPPHGLHKEVIQSDIFLKLAPKADDLWFKVMSYKQGTSVLRATNPSKKPLPIVGSQKISLKKTNVRQDGNSQQWEALVDYFHLPAFNAGLDQHK